MTRRKETGEGKGPEGKNDYSKWKHRLEFLRTICFYLICLPFGMSSFVASDVFQDLDCNTIVLRLGSSIFIQVYSFENNEISSPVSTNSR